MRDLQTWEERCHELEEKCCKLRDEHQKLLNEIDAMRNALDLERAAKENAYLRGRVDGLEYSARCNGVSGGEITR